MARSPRVPAYRLHKPSGQARVIDGGKHFYLGKFGTPESKEKYGRLIADRHSGQPPVLRPDQPASPPSGISVIELILAYWQYAKLTYVTNGKPTDEQGSLRSAFRRLRKVCGNTLATDFGPKALKSLQRSMIAEGLSRSYINDSINRIRRMFKWGTSEELVPVAVYQALRTVEGLKKGRAGVPDTKPVTSAVAADVEATLPHLLPEVAAMVQVQELAGMRPQDIRNMRTCDLDMSHYDGVWVYTPATHKTEHLGIVRRVAIGPKAQAILRPFLKPDRPQTYVFCPREAVAAMHEERRKKRVSPMTPSQRKRRQRRRASLTPGDQYGKRSYEVAIGRACKKAGVPHWTPNQLRHSCATRVRRKHGAEGAAAVLGNSLGMVVEVYAESNFQLAVKIMREMG